MSRKTITISLETWQVLLQLKGEINARSLDEVLRRLIEKWKRPSK